MDKAELKKELTDKEKLEKKLSEHITTFFEGVLDYCDVAVLNSDLYRKLRSKILRVGNNCVRNISKDLKNYNVEYEERELIVEYKQPRYDDRKENNKKE